MIGLLYAIVKGNDNTLFIVQTCSTTYMSKFECMAVLPETNVEVLTMTDLACHIPYKELLLPPSHFDPSTHTYTNTVVPIVTPTLL